MFRKKSAPENRQKVMAFTKRLFLCLSVHCTDCNEVNDKNYEITESLRFFARVFNGVHCGCGLFERRRFL